jgi:hypothetical protein
MLLRGWLELARDRGAPALAVERRAVSALLAETDDASAVVSANATSCITSRIQNFWLLERLTLLQPKLRSAAARGADLAAMP